MRILRVVLKISKKKRRTALEEPLIFNFTSHSRKSRHITLYWRSHKWRSPMDSKTLDSLVLVLCFDLLTRPEMPFKVTHRKEVTHSNGSYERKSRGRKLADEMGQGKKKSHYTLIDWCTGREWPQNCMTVISAWWRSHRPFQK